MAKCSITKTPERICQKMAFGRVPVSVGNGEAVDGHRVVLIGIVQITEEERRTMAEELRTALEGLLRKG